MIEIVLAAIAFLVALAGGVWIGRTRLGRTSQSSQTLPAEPTKTPEQHGTAIVLEQVDVIDAVAEEHAVDPGEVSDLMDLADKTRSK